MVYGAVVWMAKLDLSASSDGFVSSMMQDPSGCLQVRGELTLSGDRSVVESSGGVLQLCLYRE